MSDNTSTEKAFDYLANDGMGGFEQLNTDVISFPFIRVLQSISPQCKKSRPEYIEGATEGMLYNSVNNRLIQPPVDVIVGRFDRSFVEWKKDRGGFVATHSPEAVADMLAKGSISKADNGKLFREDTLSEFVDTFTYYIVFPDYPEDGVCLLCLTSSQLKEARRWNRLMLSTIIPGTSTRALPYHQRWTITTPPMSNDKGDWSGFHVEFAGFVTKAQYQLVSAERQGLPDASKVDFTNSLAGVVTEAIEAHSDTIDVF